MRIPRVRQVRIARVVPILLFAPLLAASLPTGVSRAGVTLDGSMGPGGALAGPDYAISADLGQIRGANLFHSFGRFDLLSTESATFSGPTTIANVIGRVTGGSPSSIDGGIRCTIPNANLYLLNPSGIMFGPNSWLDVRGSFHVSTADYLKFADGGPFYADLGRDSVLTVAAPSAFGFLGAAPAGISFQAPSGSDGASLVVYPGKTFSAVGGDIDVKAYIGAPSGRVNVASVASPGEVVPSLPGQSPDLDVSTFDRLGTITIPQGEINTSSASGGGTVVIRGGRLFIDSTASYYSAIYSSTRGTANGAPVGIDIAIRNDMVIREAEIVASSSGSGSAGNIRIAAGTVDLGADVYANGYGAVIGSRAFSRGKSGNIDITADSLVVRNNAGILTSALSYWPSGTGGNVTVEAGTVKVIDGGYVAATAYSPANAGNISVTADDILVSGASAEGYVSILGGSFNYGANGGTTTINAGTLAVRDGAVITMRTYGTGRGGDIVIDADRIEMTNGGKITADTLGTGDAGNISIRSGSLEIRDAAYITTSGYYGTGKGNAGNIDVAADRILISGREDAAYPFTNEATAIWSGVKDGRGGNITLTAGSLQMENRGQVSSASYGAGTAGNIVVTSNSVDLRNGAIVLAGAFGAGNGGTIEMTADTMVLSGVNPDRAGTFLGSVEPSPTGVGSQSVAGGGSAGDVRITAGSLEVLDGARISAETFGSGSGGNVSVTAGTLLVAGVNPALRDFLAEVGADTSFAGASILTTSHGGSPTVNTGVSGPAGNVRLAANTVTVRDGGLVSSETDASGAGGSISIASETVTLLSGGSISAKSSGGGEAGSIAIAASTAFESRNGSVTTEARQSDGGNIDLSAGSMVRLVDSEITSSVNGGPGTTGGNIAIDPDFVLLQGSRIVANAYEGQGGNIRIAAGTFLADPDSVVDASSALGIDGTIDIQAPVTDVTGGLKPLQKDYLNAAALLGGHCAARMAGAQGSSFVIGGREGLPLEPGQFLPSTLDPAGPATRGLARNAAL